MKRKFDFYGKFLTEIEKCPESLQLELCKAILNYGLRNEKPTSMSDEIRASWSRILPVLQRGESAVDEPVIFVDEREREFSEYIKNHYSHISMMEEPLTLKQYTELKNRFGKQTVDTKVSYLNDWKSNGKGCEKLYVSAYRTLMRWIAKDSSDGRQIANTQ